MDSLVSLSLDVILRNLKLYLTPDGIALLPNHLKNRILKKFLSSNVFRRKIDSNDVLSATINKDTKLINLEDITLNKNTLKLLQKAIYLNKLYLTNSCNHIIATNDLISVFEHKKYLTLLVMEKCSHVTDDVIICISKNCKNLQELSLTSCKNVTDIGVVSLRDLKLKGLSLAHTQVSAEGVLRLVSGKMGETLRELNLKSSKSLITVEFIDKLKNSCPNLASFNFDSSMCNIS